MPSLAPMAVLEPILHRLDRVVSGIGRLCEEWPRARRWISRHAPRDEQAQGKMDHRSARDEEPMYADGECSLVNLPRCADEIVARYHAIAGRRRIGICVDLPPDALVFGSARRVREAMERHFRQTLASALPGDQISLTAEVSTSRVVVDFRTYSRRHPKNSIHCLIGFPIVAASARHFYSVSS